MLFFALAYATQGFAQTSAVDLEAVFDAADVVLGAVDL